MKTKRLDFDDKDGTAFGILMQCLGTQGVWADPTRYQYQCWTRDLVLASMPLLLDGGFAPVIKKHLEALSKRVRPNGQVPILFLDKTWPFLVEKVRKTFKDGKLSFMLRRFLTGNLWNLTPGTRDSEILYIVGMYEYARKTGDRSLLDRYMVELGRAMQYVDCALLRDGLVIGCDWRDTMHEELGDKRLLTNNALLYRAYVLMGRDKEAQELRDRINEHFWDGTSYLDYQGSTRFDPLGAAFAVLNDVVPPERYPSLIASFRSVNTPYGVTIKCRHNPISAEEREVIDRTDGEVVWPFVVGFVALALLKMGERELALEQLAALERMDGFCEWYDPATGRGYGATAQLWSAVLYLRVKAAFQRRAA